MVRTAEQKLPAIHQCPICDKEDPLIRKQGRRLRSEGGAEQRLLLRVCRRRMRCIIASKTG